jgi:hypothetical protein
MLPHLHCIEHVLINLQRRNGLRWRHLGIY